MIRIFKHYIPKSLFMLGVGESFILLAAIWGGLNIRYIQANITVPDFSDNITEILSFVAVSYIVLLATGFYRLETCRDLRVTSIRLITSLGLTFVILSFVLYMLPNIDLWRSVIIYALGLSFVGLLISRYIFLHIVDLNRLKKRVLVLGAGDRAERVQACGVTGSNDVRFTNFLRMSKTENTIDTAQDYDQTIPLKNYILERGVQEIVVAIDERRGALPVDALLECKMMGCRIIEATSFIERQSGTVSLKNINPSWLIFSDGFGNSGNIDHILKRVFDVMASGLLLILTLPILFVTAILVKITSKGPIFYRQERVGLNGVPFDVLKFRSMTIDAEADGVPKWAAKNDTRVTGLGRIIRSSRID